MDCYSSTTHNTATMERACGKMTQLSISEFDALELPIEYVEFSAAASVYGIILGGKKYINQSLSNSTNS